MRIRFIEPRPPGHHVYDLALLPRLGPPLMATLLAERGHDVGCYCEVLADVDVEDCLGADLVGISSTTSTQPRAYALADELTAAGVAVVFGGSHVTFCADEALDHAPLVVRGEGQDTICELVEAIEHDTGPAGLAGVAGLSWRDADGRHHHNPARVLCGQAAFEALPIPDLSLLAGHERMQVMPLMTQWGCPFDCEFCSVTAMFSRRVRYRRPDQVLAELAGLGAERVFFHDDNFMVSRRRTRELLDGMIAADLTPGWAAQVRAAETVFSSRATRDPDHELLGLMRRAGCRMVMVGFESISDEALVQANKRQEVRDIVDAVGLFHDHDILVHGMFVVGFDTDREDQAERTVAFARRVGIDTLQIMIETPLPGTRLYRRAQAEGRLLTDDWGVYDGHHVVMEPAAARPYQLQVATIGAMERFYSLPHIIGPALRTTLRQIPDLVRVTLGGRSPTRLPTLAQIALRGRWQQLIDTVRTHSSPDVWDRIERAFTPVTLRAYGRRQLSHYRQQERTQAHLAFLAAHG